jgi:glucosamine-6-phosphate deaminase
MVAIGTLDLSRVVVFALDEYVGLPRGHQESYAEVLRRTFTEPLGLDPAQVHTPDVFAEDLATAGDAYEEAIRQAGGVDLQILGIGTNGHIGFNEPTSALNSRTRVKTLTTRTRIDNGRFFASPDEVPHHCLTQGLGTIMDARHVLLLAQGTAKAEAIAATCEGPITALVPGSVLQFHSKATVIVDEGAASALQMADYYREVDEFKLEWQRYSAED